MRQPAPEPAGGGRGARAVTRWGAAQDDGRKTASSAPAAATSSGTASLPLPLPLPLASVAQLHQRQRQQLRLQGGRLRGEVQADEVRGAGVGQQQGAAVGAPARLRQLAGAAAARRRRRPALRPPGAGLPDAEVAAGVGGQQIGAAGRPAQQGDRLGARLRVPAGGGGRVRWWRWRAKAQHAWAGRGWPGARQSSGATRAGARLPWGRHAAGVGVARALPPAGAAHRDGCGGACGHIPHVEAGRRLRAGRRQQVALQGRRQAGTA